MGVLSQTIPVNAGSVPQSNFSLLFIDDLLSSVANPIHHFAHNANLQFPFLQHPSSSKHKHRLRPLCHRRTWTPPFLRLQTTCYIYFPQNLSYFGLVEASFILQCLLDGLSAFYRQYFSSPFIHQCFFILVPPHTSTCPSHCAKSWLSVSRRTCCSPLLICCVKFKSASDRNTSVTCGEGFREPIPFLTEFEQRLSGWSITLP